MAALQTDAIRRSGVSVTFCVSGVAASGLTYVQADNAAGTTCGVVANQPPTAAFTADCPTLSCTFDASGSSDSDGTIVSYAWNFGDSNVGSGVDPSHTYSPGTYLVTLTVTDDDNADDAVANNVTAPNPAGVDAHIGDLDGSTTAAARGRWNATVTISLHDSGHGAVSGATVNGGWSNGANGSDSCVTNGNGQCSVTKNNLKSNASSVTFTITDVSLSYDAGANHDPDGDSNGTVITLSKP